MPDEASCTPLRTPPERRLIPTGTPGIYRRGKRWVAVTYCHGCKVKSTHDTKAEARREKARRDAGGMPSSREPFSTYAERWLVEYAGRTYKGITSEGRAVYAMHMRNYVIPFFRGQRLGDIGPSDVRRFIRHLTTVKPRKAIKGRDRLSPATIRRIVCPLKALLAEAYELGHTRIDASRVRIVVPGERRTPPKTLTYRQVDLLLARLNRQDRLLFLFLSRTGLRISEVLGLQWQDLEPGENGAVVVVRRQALNGRLVERTKTDHSHRRVALLPSLLSELQADRDGADFSAPLFRPGWAHTRTATTFATGCARPDGSAAWSG